MVFAWHFVHAANGYPVPFDYVPLLFPFALLDEGHTGVALFMTLSGYLFAKLLDGRQIHYGAFIRNRALRLFPLLLLVILIVGVQRLVQGESIFRYLYSVARGVVFPSLPNGGWSITVEFHYYLILPLLLWMLGKSRAFPLLLVVGSITARFLIHQFNGETQSFAYWTIAGRIDQFALGMVMFHFRHHFAKRHLLAFGVIGAFMLFYWYFDAVGGFYQSPSYPSPNLVWIFLPAIEGLAYAVGIAWYETSFRHGNGGFSRLLARMGEYSYSTYLLHFFVVFIAARFIHERVMDISNFYVACAWSLVFFTLMLIPGYLSFRFVEAPFLKLRRPYLVPLVESGTGSAPSASARPLSRPPT